LPITGVADKRALRPKKIISAMVAAIGRKELVLKKAATVAGKKHRVVGDINKQAEFSLPTSKGEAWKKRRAADQGAFLLSALFGQ